MKTVSMTPEEFGKIESQLQTLNPDAGITITERSAINGVISGNHPINWMADYRYSDGELSITGHGMFGIAGRVESELEKHLTEALLAMREDSQP